MGDVLGMAAQTRDSHLETVRAGTQSSPTKPGTRRNLRQRWRAKRYVITRSDVDEARRFLGIVARSRSGSPATATTGSGD